MTRVVADSPSIILRATHIVVITIGKVTEGASGAIEIEATLEGTLKGALTAGPVIRISGHRQLPSRRAPAGLSPWSAIDLSPGARVVVASRAEGSDEAAVFAESALIRVLPASPAEGEIRRALAIEKSGGPLSNHLQTVSEPLSAVFGEYLVARLAEDTLYRDPAGFDHVMRWFEDTGRSASLQVFVMSALVGKMLLTEPNPPGFTDRLALAAIRILGSTSDEVLAGQIVDTYLPNLVGLEGAAPKKSAQSMLRGDDAAKARARAALQRRPAGPQRDRVLAWLAGAP